MDFFVNDLSLEGQFGDVGKFKAALDSVMEMRHIAKRHGRELFCHRKLSQCQVTASMNMYQTTQCLPPSERRALLSWLTKHGPFWDDDRQHDPAEYLECRQTIVTETAVGEAAWCLFNGIDRGLVSFFPSNWEVTPLSVEWVRDDESRTAVAVNNFWLPRVFQKFLEGVPHPLNSWDQLQEIALIQCPHLVFADDAFTFLAGHPFASSAAQRILFLLNILDRFTQCFDENGNRTQEGHELYRNFFTGKKGEGGRGAAFSDSSETEKRLFKNGLTFRHPEREGETLFCSWHGKVQTPPLRFHFSWPIRANEPVYVVYIGSKITKQ